MAKRKQETEKRHVLPLPENKKSPDYFRVLVHNCITAFETVYNDRIALDFNKVIDSKMRAMILDDEEYQQETRSIKAKRIMDEAENLEELGRLAEGLDDDDGEGDPYHSDGKQNGKPKKKADKDMLTMRFKAAQMSREFLNLNANNDETEEADALNIFFVAVTKEEFEQLLTVEINEGAADGSSALMEAGDNKLPGAQDVEKRLQEIAAAASGGEPPLETLFITNPDGTVEDM